MRAIHFAPIPAFNGFRGDRETETNQLLMCLINGILQLIQIGIKHLHIFFSSDQSAGSLTPTAWVTIPAGRDFCTFTVNCNSHVNKGVATDVVLLLFQIKKQAEVRFHRSMIKGETKIALQFNAYKMFSV